MMDALSKSICHPLVAAPSVYDLRQLIISISRSLKGLSDLIAFIDIFVMN